MYRRDVDAVTALYYADYAVSTIVFRDERIERISRFWNTAFAAMRAATFITLSLGDRRSSQFSVDG